jgi:hypothetical protein
MQVFKASGYAFKVLLCKSLIFLLLISYLILFMLIRVSTKISLRNGSIPVGW